jgi:hypothetical protein
MIVQRSRCAHNINHLFKSRLGTEGSACPATRSPCAGRDPLSCAPCRRLRPGRPAAAPVLPMGDSWEHFPCSRDNHHRAIQQLFAKSSNIGTISWLHRSEEGVSTTGFGAKPVGTPEEILGSTIPHAGQDLALTRHGCGDAALQIAALTFA